jgi:hypothetical protein
MYVSLSVDPCELEEGYTTAVLEQECRKLDLEDRLHKALSIENGEIQHVQPEKLLEVLDAVMNNIDKGEQSGAAKRLMRLQFVLRHIVEMNFNIYAAAYMSPTIYGSRAIATAFAQAFSTFLILSYLPANRQSILQFPLLDAALICVLELWSICNLPSNLLPNTLSRNSLLAYLFCREKRTVRAAFILIDILNQSIVLLMPCLAALAMLSSRSSMEILFNSLSVHFVITLDELSFSSGEQAYIGSSINEFIEDTLLNLDDYAVPRSLRYMALFPLIEMH